MILNTWQRYELFTKRKLFFTTNINPYRGSHVRDDIYQAFQNYHALFIGQ